MMHQYTPRGRANGFTLIEILSVLAMIVILSSMLLPSLGRARAQAYKISCLSNMRQIGTGLQLYTDDHDSYLPPAQLPQTGSPVYSWPTLMFSYVKSEQIFVCPSGEEVKTLQDTVSPAKEYCGITTNDGSSSSVRKVNKLSYGRNLIPFNGWKTPGFNNKNKSGFVRSGTTFSVHEAAVQDASGTIHIVDAWTSICSNGNSIRGIQEEIRTDRYPDDTASKVANRHFGGFSAMFGDGHVKWRRWGSTTAAEWSIQAD